MVKFVIFGASTLGEIALEISNRAGLYCSGFFDDLNSEGSFAGKPVLGKISDLIRRCHSSNQLVFVAVGDNSARHSIVQNLAGSSAKFINIIDPNSHIMPSANLGNGNLIHAGAYIGSEVSLGNHNIIFPSVSITHHNSIKDFCFFSPNSSVGGYTTIESFCKIGMNSVVKPYQNLPENTSVKEGSVF